MESGCVRQTKGPNKVATIRAAKRDRVMVNVVSRLRKFLKGLLLAGTTICEAAMAVMRVLPLRKGSWPVLSRRHRSM
jgi:hypothetical protein